MKFFYKIICPSYEIKITDNEIYLPLNTCHISSYNDTLIFCDHEKLIRVNLSTRKYNIKNLRDTLSLDLGLNPLYITYVYMDNHVLLNCRIYSNIKGGGMSILYNFVNDTYIKFNSDHHIYDSAFFNYNGKRHYLFIDRKEYCEYRKDIMNICIVRDDFFKHIDYSFMNNDNMVILKNDSNICEIPFNLLSQWSDLIKSMYSDMYGSLENSDTIFPITLNLRDYKNIELYKKYIDSKECNIKRIYDLFKLCDYLQDCDLEYLAEMIVVYVRDNKINICKAFKYIELLYVSTCYIHLKTLIWVVYYKYGSEKFLRNIKDTSLLLNNYIHKCLDMS